jgi:hypothetical protein
MGVFATICIKFLPSAGCHGQPENLAKIEIGGGPKSGPDVRSIAVCHGVVTRGAYFREIPN